MNKFYWTVLNRVEPGRWVSTSGSKNRPLRSGAYSNTLQHNTAVFVFCRGTITDRFYWLDFEASFGRLKKTGRSLRKSGQSQWKEIVVRTRDSTSCTRSVNGTFPRRVWICRRDQRSRCDPWPGDPAPRTGTRRHYWPMTAFRWRRNWRLMRLWCSFHPKSHVSLVPVGVAVPLVDPERRRRSSRFPAASPPVKINKKTRNF